MDRNEKDLATAAEIVRLLKQAETLSMLLSPAIARCADHTIGHHNIGQALERFESLHATVYVDIHGVLPEKV